MGLHALSSERRHAARRKWPCSCIPPPGPCSPLLFPPPPLRPASPRLPSFPSPPIVWNRQTITSRFHGCSQNHTALSCGERLQRTCRHHAACRYTHAHAHAYHMRAAALPHDRKSSSAAAAMSLHPNRFLDSIWLQPDAIFWNTNGKLMNHQKFRRSLERD